MSTKPLQDAVGCTGTVRAVGIPGPSRQRLAELGVRCGAKVTVVQRTSGGGIVLSIGGSRVALDRRTASQITVENVS